MKKFNFFRRVFPLIALLFLGISSAWAGTVTFTYSDYNGQGTSSTGSNYTMADKTYVSIGDTKFYGNNNYAHFYAGGTITVTPKNGATITKVAITTTSTSYNGYESSGTYTASTGSVAKNSSNNAIVEWTGSATSAFTLAHTKQIRWTSIEVTYTTGGGSTPTVLAVPTNLSSSNVTTTTATLSWNAVANASSYTVKIGSTEYTNVNTNSYSATGLTAGTQYTWTVKAVGDGVSYSTSAYAANANFTTEAESSDDDTHWTYNFNSASAYPAEFPTATGTSAAALTKTISGHDIIINAPDAYYIINSSNNETRGLLFGKTTAANGAPTSTTAYLGFPAREGYKLTKVVVTTTSNVAGSVKMNIYDASWNAYSTEQSTTTSTKKEFTFNLSNTVANTEYRLASGSSGKNLQFDKIVLTFVEVSAYTVNFNAGANGTCATTSLTEASAGVGVTLPSCTANTGYKFLGWTATEGKATIDDGLIAGVNYKPSANTTLYAVYAPICVVTIETPSNGTLVVKNGEVVVNNGDEVANGTTLNITATPNRGYSFRNWQAIDGSTHTYTTTFTYEVTDNVTIKANFDEITKYTITLADDNTELTPEYGGESIVLPSREDAYGYTFVGWSETNVAEETTTAPTIIPAGEYMPTATIPLYPVYTRSEAGGSTDVPVSIVIADKLPAGTASGDKVASFILDEHVTAASTGGESNSSKIYGSPLSQWRFYRTDGGAMTISTDAGTLKSVSITYSVDNNGVMLHGEDEIASGFVVDNINATSIVFTVGGGKNGGTNGVIRVTNISVVYTVDGSTTYYISTPQAPATATITLNAACTDGEKVYGTYCNASAWVVPANLTVSEVGVNDGKLVVVDYETGAIVPANTGVMVSASKGGDYRVRLTDEEGAHPAGVTNALRASGADGITAAAMAAADPSCMYYRLTMHNGTTIGFWWGAANGAAFALAANKAYLAVPNSASLNSMLWFNTNEEVEEGITTDVEHLVLDVKNGIIYDLMGRVVARPLPGHIYIQNGEKYLAK